MAALREVLALIPARGGSVGIPRKNLRRLGGRPLIAWSLLAAKRAVSVSRVVVSTDDPEIAAVSRKYGAEVLARPHDLAGATATSESALLHALDTLAGRDGYEPELVVFLQATSPFRRPADIDGAVAKLDHSRADSLFSAGPAHGFVWRCQDTGPTPLNYTPEHRPRRQDAPRDVVENGSIYVFRPEILRAHGSRLAGRIATYPMLARDSFQIDELEDLALHEALLAMRRNEVPDARLAAVRLLLLDFDGVLTDNRVLVQENGVEGVACHRGDSWGLARLQESGVSVEVISTETNPVVAARCKKLGIRCERGVRDKRAAVRARIGAHQLTSAEVAFVGNDVNDLPALDAVGLPVAVADAVPEVRGSASWVTERRGGDGAVREICDRLLRARAHLDARPSFIEAVA